MYISRFMKLGIFWTALFTPILCILLCHLMFSWQEKGVFCAEETAKFGIKTSLIVITWQFVLAFALLIWMFLPGRFNFLVFYGNTIGKWLESLFGNIFASIALYVK